MDPIFDESELKVELQKLGVAAREAAEELIALQEDSSDSDNIGNTQDDEYSGDPEQGPSATGMYPEFRKHMIRDDQSEDEILGDLDNDSEYERESSSSSDSISATDELDAQELSHPSILNEGPPRILPQTLVEAVDEFRCKLQSSREIKDYSSLSSSEQKLADKKIQDWRQQSPLVSEDVEEQLKAELLTFSLVNYALKQGEQGELVEDDSDDESHPALFSKLGLLSDIFTRRNREENLSIKFFSYLREHECFQQYRPYLDSLSEEQISTLIWDCAVQTQRVIVRLSNLHESAISTLDNLIKLSSDATDISKSEAAFITAEVQKEAARNIRDDEHTELSTKGRRNLVRSCTAPYFKTPEGFAAPRWNPYPLPFKYEQLRRGPISDSELNVLQVAVLKTVIETKQHMVEDRCNQLLLRSGKDGLVWQRLTLKGALPFEVKILCTPEDLLRWKSGQLAKCEKTTFKDLVTDPEIRINWLSVAAKANKNTTRYYWPDECRQIWDKLIRSRILNNRQMTFDEVQKLMASVKNLGTRRWTKVANEMGYSAFQCFEAYEAFREGEMGPEERLVRRQADLLVGANKFQKILKLGKEFQPQIPKEKFIALGCQVAGIIADTPNVPLQALAEHYNRTLKPEQKGTFKVVEDLLLLVCMVKMREYLKVARTFVPIRDYLPWRFVSAWACRAEVLFGRRSTIWTREDDLKLLEIARTHDKFDWALFSSMLGGDKNRRNTRKRYMLLKERLRHDSFENIRTEYERQNPRPLYTSFERYLPPLDNVLQQPKVSPPTYEQLASCPDEALLWNYLQSFDNVLIEQTINDIKAVVAASTRAEVPKQLSTDVKKKMKITIDRRRFVRGDPVSTASALHLRRLNLKPRGEVNPLNSFEETVYDYFEYFNKRGTKTVTKHPYLPTADKLFALSELRRILARPEPEEIESENASHQPTADPETDDIPLDSNGFPIIDAPKPAKRPRKARSRRNIGLINLAKAREKRRDNLEKQQNSYPSPDDIAGEVEVEIEEDDSEEEVQAEAVRPKVEIIIKPERSESLDLEDM